MWEEKIIKLPPEAQIGSDVTINPFDTIHFRGFYVFLVFCHQFSWCHDSRERETNSNSTTYGIEL